MGGGGLSRRESVEKLALVGGEGPGAQGAELLEDPVQFLAVQRMQVVATNRFPRLDAGVVTAGHGRRAPRFQLEASGRRAPRQQLEVEKAGREAAQVREVGDAVGT